MDDNLTSADPLSNITFGFRVDLVSPGSQTLNYPPKTIEEWV